VAVLRFLTSWANAPFAIAAGVAVAFVLLQVTGVLGLLAGDSSDAHGGVDHEVDHDVDAGGEHDVDHDADADGDHASQGYARGLGAAGLALLGVGRVPLSLIWQAYALVFAIAGFTVNLKYLGGASPPPLVSLVWSVPFALVAGYFAVAAMARVLGPVLSSKEHEATSRAQLVGQIGVVISSRVDDVFGEVRIRDKTGHDVRVMCRLSPGATPVGERARVVVVDYEDERGELLVQGLDDAVDDDAAGGRKGV